MFFTSVTQTVVKSDKVQTAKLTLYIVSQKKQSKLFLS